MTVYMKDSSRIAIVADCLVIRVIIKCLYKSYAYRGYPHRECPLQAPDWRP